MSKQDFSNVSFSELQLAYLESVYPPLILPPTATEPQVHHFFGTQAVVAVVREKTRGNTNRLAVVNPNHIPAP